MKISQQKGRAGLWKAPNSRAGHEKRKKMSKTERGDENIYDSLYITYLWKLNRVWDHNKQNKINPNAPDFIIFIQPS